MNNITSRKNVKNEKMWIKIESIYFLEYSTTFYSWGSIIQNYEQLKEHSKLSQCKNIVKILVL